MPRRKQGRAVNGWLNLDKPPGMTSTKAVNIVKRLFNARKAGHAGTLDPLATGVLPIGFGEATKTMNFAVDGDKAYRFDVRWGAQTTTDDCEGEIFETRSGRPTLPEIESAIDGFIGEIMQVPPQFSAIKVDGQRAYDLARDGEDVELAARPVVVHDLVITAMPDDETTTFEARCGKGTYVRAIARDMGRKLGCLGHIVALRRTQVGPFHEDDAVQLSELEALDGGEDGHGADDGAARDSQDRAGLDGAAADQAEIGDGVPLNAEPNVQAEWRCSEFLLPVSAALSGLVELPVGGNDERRIRSGQPVILRGRDAPVFSGTAYATARGRLIALGEVERGSFIPTRVFNL